MKAFIFFLFLVTLFLYLFLDLVFIGLNSADGSLYLNIAENISSRTGYVLSSNLYQYFQGAYHNIFTYYQPLYPIFISLFIKFGGVPTVVLINMILYAVSVTIIYRKLEKLLPGRANILFILILALSLNAFFTSLYPWTEQFYFALLLLTMFVFLNHYKKSQSLVLTGLLNGVLMLVRVSHALSFLGFIIFILVQKKSLSNKCRSIASFVFGFILFYGSYQIFCLLKFGQLYPQCPNAAIKYAVLAPDHTGILYSLNQVGIHLQLPSFFSVDSLNNIRNNLAVLLRQLPLLVPAIMISFLFVFVRRNVDLWIQLCLVNACVTFFGLAILFYPCKIFPEFEALRYSMIPYIFSFVVIWYFFNEIISFSNLKHLDFLTGIILATILFFKFNGAVNYKDHMESYYKGKYYRDYRMASSWINQNLPRGVIISSNEVQMTYNLHRPFVSTPPGRALNKENLVLYDKIYKPDYYLVTSSYSSFFEEFLPLKLLYSNSTFSLHQRLFNEKKLKADSQMNSIK